MRGTQHTTRRQPGHSLTATTAALGELLAVLEVHARPGLFSFARRTFEHTHPDAIRQLDDQAGAIELSPDFDPLG